MPRPEELPPLEQSPDDVRDAAREIVSRPEFAEPPKTIWERIQEAIDEALNDILSAVLGGGRDGIVALVILLAVLGVVGFLVFRLVQANVRRAPSADGAVVTTDPLLPPEDWDARAAAHAIAGEWREAMRCRYRALVARMARGGVVEEIPGRTAGEYRLDVTAQRPAAAEPFGEATDLFEQVWYGGAAGSADDEARLTENAEAALERSRQ